MSYERQTFKDNETILTAEHLNHIEDGIVQNEDDIKKKADLDKAGKIKPEQLPDNLLTDDDLPDAVNEALTQAKESGEFNGADGKDGADGYTPQKGIDYFDGKDGEKGDPFTYEDFTEEQLAALKGEKGEDGKTPEKGVDYFTETDKQELVADVLDSLPEWQGGSY